MRKIELKATRITSAHNPIVKEAVAVRSRKRSDNDLFFMEGENLLNSALEAAEKCEVTHVFYTREFFSANPGIINSAASKGAKIIETSIVVMDKLSSLSAPPGIAALARYNPGRSTISNASDSGVLILCDAIGDPGNLGTIIRTADAMGAGGVLISPGCADVFLDKTLRATAGSVFNIPIFAFSSMNDLISELRSGGIKLLAAEPRADLTVAEINIPPRAAIAFGSESRGISAEILNASDIRFRIPMQGRAESLNVTAAAAICIYKCMMRRIRPTA